MKVYKTDIILNVFIFIHCFKKRVIIPKNYINGQTVAKDIIISKYKRYMYTRVCLYQLRRNTEI